MRSVMQDAACIKRFHHASADRGESARARITACVATAMPPTQTNDAKPASVPPSDFIRRTNRIGALHQNHNAKRAFAGKRALEICA